MIASHCLLAMTVHSDSAFRQSNKQKVRFCLRRVALGDGKIESVGPLGGKSSGKLYMTGGRSHKSAITCPAASRRPSKLLNRRDRKERKESRRSSILKSQLPSL